MQAREYAPGGVEPTDAPPSTATVVAALTDINDNPPVFLLDHYFGVVPEDASIDHIVIASIDAFDRDQVNLPTYTRDYCYDYYIYNYTIGIQRRVHI